MVIQKTWQRVGIALWVGAVVLGASAVPAAASEGSSEISSSGSSASVPTPEGVSVSEWSLTFEEAQSVFGEGDRAYLEALKSISPKMVDYCHQRTVWNVVPPGLYHIPTSSSASPEYNCVMESGLSSNAAVEVLQTALNHCYGASLAVDGSFGSGTYTALMSAQASHGVGMDGVYGPTTRSVLRFPGSSGCLTIAQIQSF
ncbi:peptidoglycan hydrolase-like protein with peptidoglycan-binding domain [Microbacterium resistens]|uniref:Peptidoglycan hydrolase-like protein with peptidoglycan-binding domain n=1 Tax=Microbacterium resistens TaxID=156977 RepID=A0ABU1SCT8_9MICO|nr:peptidoglycan-binding domain-containing protein [Microbacterium resistens]MDR6867418.1 peptidoglycan hydrolase-like protein with peptidoglycan-binding domain [Microbacterium resistens]